MHPRTIASSALFLLSTVRTAAGAEGSCQNIPGCFDPDAESCSARAHCKNIPGDPGWPDAEAWKDLNQTVNGQLIATVPVAHVCHDPTFSNASCEAVNQGWNSPPFMVAQPEAIYSVWFQNDSCAPYTSRSRPCELGNYPSYIINVTGIDDVKAGLRFAQDNNVRLVIRSTGHDFYGKSTGHGAVSLWMHHLNSKEFISNYSSPYYNGAAIRIGPGVSSGDAVDFASQHGYIAVVGSCPTVAVAGGFTQGGGHAPTSGAHGFGADNVLEWAVVLASGEYVIATPTQNQPLYWAMSGGGGGTYGVAVSLTMRVFPETGVASASLSFNVTTAGGVDNFWAAVATFFEELRPTVTEFPMTCTPTLTNDTLSVSAMLVPGIDANGLSKMIQPVMSALAEKGISSDAASLEVTESTFPEVYFPIAEVLEMPTGSPVMGGRFVSQSNMLNNSAAVMGAIREVADAGYLIIVQAMDVKGEGRISAPVSDNAMQPAFQDAYLLLGFFKDWFPGQDWSVFAEQQDDLLNRIMPKIEAATPGAGVYINEGNWEQPNFQREFYGDTYHKLRAIKRQYDPNDIFYGLTAVGSEAWAPDAQGRLCRTGY